MDLIRALVGGALVGAIASGAACANGTGQRYSAFDDPGSGDAGASNPAFDAPPFGADVYEPPPYSCSADLHSLVDAQGTLVQQCPADQGCANGACVPACAAAAAGRGNIGCDFVVATPSFFADYAGNPSYFSPCFAVFLTNNWGTPMTIAVTRAGTTYDVSAFGRIPVAGQPESAWLPVPAEGVPPGEVAVLFMEQNPSTSFACPVTPALSDATAVQGTARGQAWHIVMGAPGSAYDILPYGGASSFLPSAELLLPTSAWGTNYVAIIPKRVSGSADGANAAGPQWGQILAMEDDTQVLIVPTVDLPAGANVAAAPANQVTSYTLNAGEFVQWQDPYKYPNGGASPMEMSGTILGSSKPIAFMGGNGYLCLGSQTSTGGGCDSGHQQIAPVSALGSEYAPAPYTTRRADLVEESIPFRVVGLVKGTILTFDPPIPGAPAGLTNGQWADFEASDAFVVKSQDAQHPFYLGQMMTGCSVMGGSRSPGGCLGDEEYLNVMPPAQFLSSYVFFTDPTYPTTTFTLVREKGPLGFRDVTIDCFDQPVAGWKPLGSSAFYEWATVDLVRAGSANGHCQNGPHSATSTAPFGLTVWGLAEAASYGYPAGTNVAVINQVVIPPTPQ